MRNNHTITRIALLIALVITFATACGSAASGPAVLRWVTPQDIYSQLPGALDEGMILLDVRTRQEWEQEGHIEGATLIPLEELSARAATELPDKEAEIIVYCNTGNRSTQAAYLLLNAGYTDVSDMGGIQGWINAGLPVEYGP